MFCWCTFLMFFSSFWGGEFSHITIHYSNTLSFFSLKCSWWTSKTGSVSSKNCVYLFDTWFLMRVFHPTWPKICLKDVFLLSIKQNITGERSVTFKKKAAKNNNRIFVPYLQWSRFWFQWFVWIYHPLWLSHVFSTGWGRTIIQYVSSFKRGKRTKSSNFTRLVRVCCMSLFGGFSKHLH